MAAGTESRGAGSSVPTLATDDPVLVGFAEEVGTDGPVAVEGARTRWATGGPPAPDVRLVRAPTGIVEYTPEEMTVTVRAGTPVAELHAALAERGQRTALPGRGGTVGGALAVGESDPRALGRGLVRTALLQVRYVSAEGRVVSGGGPTVKNVSGFDLPRLLVGSLGTLGLVAEVILRTNPIPPVGRWLRLDGVDPARVHDQLLAPAAVLWDGTTTWVQLEGHGADVDAQQRLLDAMGPVEEIDVDGPDGLPVDLPDNRWSLPPAEVTAGGSAPARVTAGGSTSARVTADAERFGRFVAVVGLGLVFAERAQPTRPLDPAVAEVARRLKHNFDPDGRLNPGRDPAQR